MCTRGLSLDSHPSRPLCPPPPPTPRAWPLDCPGQGVGLSSLSLSTEAEYWAGLVNDFILRLIDCYAINICTVWKQSGAYVTSAGWAWAAVTPNAVILISGAWLGSLGFSRRSQDIRAVECGVGGVSSQPSSTSQALQDPAPVITPPPPKAAAAFSSAGRQEAWLPPRSLGQEGAHSLSAPVVAGV